jgi:glycosyltransferase involved in cell wall biosynthesis
MGCPVIGTVHDLSQIHVPGKYDGARQFYARHVLPRLIRRLTHVVTVSRSSKHDIVEYAGVPEDRVTVIPNGVDLDRFRPREKDEARADLDGIIGRDAPFLLYVSRLEHPGKNHVRLIRAFDLFKRQTGLPHRLVLAGPDWSGAEVIHAAAAKADYSGDILCTGFVHGRDLPSLYAAADALVFPSLYEGFGIPLLEAMATGTAVAAARCSSLPEVGGDAALYFDPQEPEEIAAAMSRIVSDDILRRQMVASGLSRASEFSWERTASLTLEVIREVARDAA